MANGPQNLHLDGLTAHSPTLERGGGGEEKMVVTACSFLVLPTLQWAEPNAVGSHDPPSLTTSLEIQCYYSSGLHCFTVPCCPGDLCINPIICINPVLNTHIANIANAQAQLPSNSGCCYAFATSAQLIGLAPAGQKAEGSLLKATPLFVNGKMLFILTLIRMSGHFDIFKKNNILNQKVS